MIGLPEGAHSSNSYYRSRVHIDNYIYVLGRQKVSYVELIHRLKSRGIMEERLSDKRTQWERLQECSGNA